MKNAFLALMYRLHILKRKPIHYRMGLGPGRYILKD
jgi:hypothetical protein